MQKIILISGPIGCGKTTTARKLYEALDSASLIEADGLVKYKPWSMDDQSLKVKSANCNALIKTYLDEGIDNVVCEGYVQNQFELEALEEIFKSNAKIYVFWLELSREERQRRVAGRGQGDADTPEFMDEYEKSNAQPWPFTSDVSVLESISVEGKSIEGTVQTILDGLQAD